MTLHKNLTDARTAAKENRQIQSILEIEHRDDGPGYICITCSAEYMRAALKRKPMAEIVRVIASHSIRTPAEQEEIAAVENNTVEIYLSSRGWGDYSACTYRADLRKSDVELLAECRKALADGVDVDVTNQTDAEILSIIANARVKNVTPKPAALEAEAHGHGYCYSCESYCYGDCGDYQPAPTSKTIARELKQMNDEANYGINNEA